MEGEMGEAELVMAIDGVAKEFGCHSFKKRWKLGCYVSQVDHLLHHHTNVLDSHWERLHQLTCEMTSMDSI